MKNENIDSGNEFDWGKASDDYAKFRDIYPESFYQHILNFNIGQKGQNVLDLGTGTGVLPRAMAKYGAHFTGADISKNQIKQAILLSQGLDINYIVNPAEQTGLPDHKFDAVTAVQCWFYFDSAVMAKEILRLLKPNGRLMVAFMNYLPLESEIARRSEELILKYNPSWSGANFKSLSLSEQDWPKGFFSPVSLESYTEDLLFTRESWRGRMRACRGIAASIPPEKIEEFDAEHDKLLREIAGEQFTVKHQIIFILLSPKK